MFYLAICDDDPQETERLKSYLLSLHEQNIAIEISTFNNGYDLITAHRTRNFHLILLDMLMEPISGLETAKTIRQFDKLVNIIFITVTSEYAVKSYSVNAVQYLLKPIDKERLLEVTLPLLNSALDYRSQAFTISSNEGAYKVALSDILYFESNLRKITLVTTSGVRHEFYGKISEIEEQLEDYYFIRTHKSFVVNLRYVKNVQATNLVLDNDAVLPISRRRYKDILDRFLELSVNH